MAKIDIRGAIVDNEDGWIYEYFGEPYTSPGDVFTALEEAGGEDVDVDINSYGGSVFAGSEIYSALRAYKGSVNIHIVGLAASAASVIACAGHSDISPTAQIMVHNVSANAGGDYHDMDKMSERLKQANRAIAQAYRDKAGMSEQEALDLMDAETWLTAEDAVAWGLVDEIAGNQNANMKLTASASGGLPPSVINKMQAKKQSLMDYFSN